MRPRFPQISPIISIVFNMLIIRVGLAHDSSLGASGSHGWSTAMMSDRGSHLRRRLDGTFEMKDLSVEITQVVEDDSQFGRDQELAPEALELGSPTDSCPPSEWKGGPLDQSHDEFPRQSAYSSLGSEKAANDGIV